jgi:hypothetical protein
MKVFLGLLLAFVTAVTAGQTKEKLKGSRNVTVERREMSTFHTIEVEDNIEAFLVKADQPGIDIEADDNLHEAIVVSENAGTLRVSAKAEVTGARKFSVRIYYTSSLTMLIAREDANITALTDVNLESFTVKSSGNAKIYMTSKNKTFTLMMNDKSKMELNLTAATAELEVSKNAQVKALITSPKLKVDLYQKATAILEGDSQELKLRLGNQSALTGKNLITKNVEIVAEESATCSIAVTGVAIIEASGKSEVELYGEQQKIELRKFSDNALIKKKSGKVSH